MMMRQTASFFLGTGLTMLTLGLTACEASIDALPDAPATQQAGDAGRPAQDSAGGASGDSVVAGKAGSIGGSAPHVEGHNVLAVFETVVALQIVAWPKQRRVAVQDETSGTVKFFEVDGAEVRLVGELTAVDLLEGASSIETIAAYGETLLVVVSAGEAAKRQYVIQAQLGTAPKTLLGGSESVYELVANPEFGIAAATADGLKFARPGATTFALLSAGYASPLALERDRLLVGIAGEPARKPEGAKLQWLGYDGSVLQSFPSIGYPTVAVKDEAGWLIGETSSFWSGMEAGIQLLNSTGLHTLTRVPLISSNDGADGAHDLVHAGSQLLVANCESGVLRGAFDGSEVVLSPLTGPWSGHSYGSCGPTAIESLGDVVVVGGGTSRLLFLRASAK